MASLTFRLDSATANSFHTMPETDVTAASLTDGWTVAKIAAANDSEYLVGTKRASTTFSTEAGTPKPGALATGASANALRSLNAYNGQFDAAAWTLTFAVRATVASSQAGRVRCRVYASANADGTSARELTGSTQVGTTSVALSTTADVTTVVTWTPASAIVMQNEYLFFVLAWEITTASGSNTADVVFRTGQSAGGTRIVTSNFTAYIAPPLRIPPRHHVSRAMWPRPRPV